MKLNRDSVAPPIGQLDQDSAQLANWRDDLAQVALASVGVLVVGLVILLGMVMYGVRSVTLLASVAYVVLALAAGPWVMLAGLSIATVWLRHYLGRVRVRAEENRLLSELDLNSDGEVSDREMFAFLRYLRHLHRDRRVPTTAAEAQRIHVPRVLWAKYKGVIVNLGLADYTDKRGGEGFTMRDMFYVMGWERVEKGVKDRVNGDMVVVGALQREHRPSDVPRKNDNEKQPRVGKGRRLPTSTIDMEAEED